MSDPGARLADMDADGIEISVVFPTLFLISPLVDDLKLLAAMCRAYNEWAAEKCRATNGQTADVIGDQCILYASDLPHAHRVFDAINIIFRERKDIKEKTRAKILEENGRRFFGL